MKLKLLLAFLVTFTSGACAQEAKPANLQQAAPFWAHQSTPPPKDLHKQIIGQYEGSCYLAEWNPSTPFEPLNGIKLEFFPDGVFTTNFPAMLEKNRPANRAMTKFSDKPLQGKFQVPSSTQLIMAPGHGVTSFGVRLTEGHLTFYHEALRCMFSLQKVGTSPRVDATLNIRKIAGAYEGTAYIAEESDNKIGIVKNVEITFLSNGSFLTNFGHDQNGIFKGFNSAGGRYAADSANMLACNFEFSGGDFFGAEASGFYDWEYRNGCIHLNSFHGAYYAAALVLAPKGQNVQVDNTSALAKLTKAPYHGTAYRAQMDGSIERIDDIKLVFRTDGTYESNFPEKLMRPEEQYYPDKSGPYAVLSDRHLYMARSWQGALTGAGISDCLISDNKLTFTSLEDDAYLVLESLNQ